MSFSEGFCLLGIEVAVIFAVVKIKNTDKYE